jgi:hypothetical protein
MSCANPLRQCRRLPIKSWVGALLVVFLLLAETLAVTHAYDLAAHATGQQCAVCVGAASFDVSDVGAPVEVIASAAAPVIVLAVLAVLFSVARTLRYARGPPVVSFTP